MGSPNVPLSKDHSFPTPMGEIFAREWLPETLSHTEPILLFHDSLGCVELWRDFPALLSDRTGRRVIAYDRLGYGRSATRHEPMPLTFIHDEADVHLPLVVRHFGIDRFIAFGHSVGGEMAVVAAGRFPERCLAVITESAQSFSEDRTLQGVAQAKRSFAEPGQVDRLMKYHGEKAEWVLHAWTDTWLSPEFANWSLKPDLALVRCPVLALHGDRDEFGSTKHPELIRDHARGPVEMHVLQGCGHVPHREQTAKVLELVAQFLERRT